MSVDDLSSNNINQRSRAQGSFPSVFTTGKVFSFCPETRCRLVFSDICQQIGKFLKTIQNDHARNQEPGNILP